MTGICSLKDWCTYIHTYSSSCDGANCPTMRLSAWVSLCAGRLVCFILPFEHQIKVNKNSAHFAASGEILPRSPRRAFLGRRPPPPAGDGGGGGGRGYLLRNFSRLESVKWLALSCGYELLVPANREVRPSHSSSTGVGGHRVVPHVSVAHVAYADVLPVHTSKYMPEV